MSKNEKKTKRVVPKRARRSFYAQNDWYSYYAGYSDCFVNDCIEKYSIIDDSFCILDPWNGSGTTTFCASIKGINSIGFDINPAMSIIASAKMFDVNTKTKEDWLSMIEREENSFTEIEYSDPLCEWFSYSTVCNIRRLEKKLCGVKRTCSSIYKTNHFNSISLMDAYVYLCLFIVTRCFCEMMQGSNPTWVKKAFSKKLSVSYSELCDSFISITEMHRSSFEKRIKREASIGIAVSEKLPIKNESIDLIITSPPYCTRIDYAIYTQIENAILGYGRNDIRNLRSMMIGSPTIHSNSLQAEISNKALYCNELLKTIGSHNSKAALSYYYKTYKQYFVEMSESMNELFRVLKVGGKAIIVVQDSWFKDIHVDVPRSIMELGELLGLHAERIDYSVKNNMAFINTKSRKYTKDKKGVESVIVFEKGENLYVNR